MTKRARAALAAVGLAAAAGVAAAQDRSEPLPAHAKLRIGDARRWAAVSKEERERGGQLAGAVQRLTVSLDGKRLAADTFGRVLVYCVADGRLEREIRLGAESRPSMAFSADGASLSIPVFDGLISEWNVATGAETRRQAVSPQEHLYLHLSADARRGVVENHRSRRVEVWDLAAGAMTASSERYGSIDYAFSRDGSRIACGSHDATLVLASKDLSEVARFGFTSMRFALDDAGSTLLATSPWTLAVADVAGGQTRFEKRAATKDSFFCSAALSPDGTLVATGGIDGRVHVLDARDGSERAVLAGHEGPVTALTFLGDAASLASGSLDETIVIWDVAHAVADAPTPAKTETPAARDALGDPLPAGAVARFGTTRLRGPGWSYACAFAADGSWIAAGGRQSLAVWDVETGKPLRELYAPLGDVVSIAVAPDGSQLASVAVNDGEIRRWDAKTWRALPSLVPSGPASPDSVAYSPDGATVVAHCNGFNGGAGVVGWRAADGAPLFDRREEGAGRSGGTIEHGDLAFVGDGRLLAARGRAGAIELLDAKTGAVIREVRAADADLGGPFAFSPDGKRVAGALFMDDRAASFDAASGKRLASFGEVMNETGVGARIGAIAFTPDGRHVIVAGAAGARGPTSGAGAGDVRVFDAATGKLVSRWSGAGDEPSCVAVSADGRLVAWSGVGPALHVARLPDLAPALAATGHASPVRGARVLAGGVVMTVDEGGETRTWDLATGAPKAVVLHGLDRAVASFDVAADGNRIAFVGHDLVAVANAADGRVLLNKPWEYPETPVAVAFLDDGRNVAVAFTSGALRVLDAATGQETTVRPAGPRDDFYARLTPLADGRVFVAGSSGCAFIAARAPWTVTPMTSGEPLCSGTIDAGGTVAVTIGRQGPLCVREVATKKRRFTKFDEETDQHAASQRVTAVSPDGKLVAAATESGSVFVWNAAEGADVASFLRADLLPGTRATCLVFSPDSRFLVVGRDDTTSLVFRLP